MKSPIRPCLPPGSVLPKNTRSSRDLVDSYKKILPFFRRIFFILRPLQAIKSKTSFCTCLGDRSIIEISLLFPSSPAITWIRFLGIFSWLDIKLISLVLLSPSPCWSSITTVPSLRIFEKQLLPRVCFNRTARAAPFSPSWNLNCLPNIRVSRIYTPKLYLIKC